MHHGPSVLSFTAVFGGFAFSREEVGFCDHTMFGDINTKLSISIEQSFRSAFFRIPSPRLRQPRLNRTDVSAFGSSHRVLWATPSESKLRTLPPLGRTNSRDNSLLTDGDL